MAHNFAHAYSNVKIAVEGLVAADTLRASLNRASEHFEIINDDDFNQAPKLRGEFRSLRARLHRNPKHRKGSMIKSLDNTESADMILLAHNLIGFMEKMESSEYSEMAPHEAPSSALSSSIRDPGLDDWDDKNEGD